MHGPPGSLLQNHGAAHRLQGRLDLLSLSFGHVGFDFLGQGFHQLLRLPERKVRPGPGRAARVRAEREGCARAGLTCTRLMPWMWLLISLISFTLSTGFASVRRTVKCVCSFRLGRSSSAAWGRGAAGGEDGPGRGGCSVPGRPASNAWTPAEAPGGLSPPLHPSRGCWKAASARSPGPASSGLLQSSRNLGKNSTRGVYGENDARDQQHQRCWAANPNATSSSCTE